ncbi:MAG: UbiD family decarboxylase [Ferruginibacter sp.]
MVFRTLEESLLFLEKHNELIRVKEEVDPNLEMAAIQLKVFASGGPALLFENVKGSAFRCASNIFGTVKRSKLLFADTIPVIQELINLKSNPAEILKKPWKYFNTGFSAIHALPKSSTNINPDFKEISISQLPLIKHWPRDGGAFVTLPQVYSEDINQPGIKHSNLGMYRIQLDGNDYILNEEVGLHYQLHRGIGVHQSMANQLGKPLKVSIFIGGPPAHSVAAVMPLPEGMSELSFAGILGNRRFRYTYDDGYCVSNDADFVIMGDVYPGDNKPEGPFGDHLGYYSLRHDFPVLKVRKVLAKKNAIWPFTVVGRPPQEDTSFGALIHELTGTALRQEIPGLKEVNAVDAAGVHPLLLATGSERYTPYNPTKQPAELLTIANRILGTGQLSLAKFLIITAGEKNIVSTSDIPGFFQYVLERIDLGRDVHFYTKTSIDTLDYSGTGLNTGSKVVLAAFGDKKRSLATEIPATFSKLVMPGIITTSLSGFQDYNIAAKEINQFALNWRENKENPAGIMLIIICDDAGFTSLNLNNFLWVTFTRSNPSHDIYGVESFIEHKHWGCRGPLIIDARIKPHHAPPLEVLPETQQSIQRLFEKNGSLYGW